jgi:hypothetical protein
MYHFQETDWAVPPQTPVAVDEDGVPRDLGWLGALMALASAAVSITMIVAMVRLVF